MNTENDEVILLYKNNVGSSWMIGNSDFMQTLFLILKLQ